MKRSQDNDESNESICNTRTDDDRCRDAFKRSAVYLETPLSSEPYHHCSTGISFDEYANRIYLRSRNVSRILLKRRIGVRIVHMRKNREMKISRTNVRKTVIV